jgi:hypothetical protein
MSRKDQISSVGNRLGRGRWAMGEKDYEVFGVDVFERQIQIVLPTIGIVYPDNCYELVTFMYDLGGIN